MQNPQRPPVDAFDPTFHVDEEIHQRLRLLERLDHDVSQLEPSLENRRKMLRDALSYNAHGTASIEGNPLTLEDVQSLLRDGPTPDHLHIPDEREILNWAAFMEALDEHPTPTTVQEIADMHAGLFAGVMDERKGLGRFKDRPNYIGRRDGTVVYIPTPPERVELELQNALDWYHTCAEPPLIKAWLWHHEFESIHPFLDGNGRIGRALMTLMLHHAGYPGVRYALVDHAFNTARSGYYEALRSAQGDPPDHTEWLRYLSGIFVEAYTDAVTRLAAAGSGLNPRQAQIAAWFRRLVADNRKRRVKFGDVHAAFPHIARRTLQEDIKALVERGFLDKQGERKATTYGVG